MQGCFPYAPMRPILVLGFEVDEAIQTLKRVVVQRFYSSGRLRYYIELEKVIARSRVIEMPSQTTEALTTRTRIRIKRGPKQRELLENE